MRHSNYIVTMYYTHLCTTGLMHSYRTIKNTQTLLWHATWSLNSPQGSVEFGWSVEKVLRIEQLVVLQSKLLARLQKEREVFLCTDITRVVRAHATHQQQLRRETEQLSLSPLCSLTVRTCLYTRHRILCYITSTVVWTCSGEERLRITLYIHNTGPGPPGGNR